MNKSVVGKCYAEHTIKWCAWERLDDVISDSLSEGWHFRWNLNDRSQSKKKKRRTHKENEDGEQDSDSKGQGQSRTDSRDRLGEGGQKETNKNNLPLWGCERREWQIPPWLPYLETMAIVIALCHLVLFAQFLKCVIRKEGCTIWAGSTFMTLALATFMVYLFQIY